MDSAFDCYAAWLGIEDKQRPLTNYQLLGLAAFESRSDTIESHTRQQLAKLAPLLKGQQMLQAKRLAFEIESAKTCLLNPATKAAYDAGLRLRECLPNVQATQPIVTTNGQIGPLPPPSSVPSSQTTASPVSPPMSSPEDDIGEYALQEPVGVVSSPQVAQPQKMEATLVRSLPSRQFRRKKNPWPMRGVVGGIILVIVGGVFVIAFRHKNLPIAIPKADMEQSGQRVAKTDLTPVPAHVPPKAATAKQVPPIMSDGRIIIVKALYGVPGRQTDVTSILQRTIGMDQFTPIQVDNEALGDPAPNQQKRLIVLYRFRNDDLTLDLSEQDVAVVPPIPSAGLQLATARRKFTVVAARFGAGMRWLDVTSEVRKVVTSPGSRVVCGTCGANFGVARDPCPGVAKHLAIWFDYQGLRHVRFFEEDETLTLLPGAELLAGQDRGVPPAPASPPIAKRSEPTRKPNTSQRKTPTARQPTGGDSVARKQPGISKKHLVPDLDSYHQNDNPPIVNLLLPSGAKLSEEMLAVPCNWEKKLFPDEKATIYVAMYPNDKIRGVFTLDNAKLDGAAVALFENECIQTLAFYKRGNLDGRMIQWKENGERLLYADYKYGRKNGLLCFFQVSSPWLLQEWDKGTVKTEYLVKSKELMPKAQMNEEEKEEFMRGIAELALLETNIKDSESKLKRDLSEWYREEKERIRWEEFAKQAPDKRERANDRHDDKANRAAIGREMFRRRLSGP